MPMIDFRVVVLPAPLRPSSVTTSPGSTSKLAPCSTWDSPYHACSPSTANSGATVGLSMAGTEVGFAHARVGGDGLVIAFRQHASAREHGDAVGQIGHHAEIVLDHQDGAVCCNGFDKRADTVDIFVSHPGHRLVEQEHFRIERQGGGDLEGAFATVRQLDRRPMGE